jgi:hypothetical protein
MVNMSLSAGSSVLLAVGDGRVDEGGAVEAAGGRAVVVASDNRDDRPADARQLAQQRRDAEAFMRDPKMGL